MPWASENVIALGLFRAVTTDDPVIWPLASYVNDLIADVSWAITEFVCPIVNVSVEKLAVNPELKFIVLAATTGE